MPTFEFTSPEGKSYTVNGPRGATKEQAFEILQTQIGQQKTSEPQSRVDSGIQLYKDAGKAALELGAGGLRGVKDVIDTGADWLSNLGGAEENARIKAMNKQGKNEFAAKYGDNTTAQIGRIGGNIAATLPVGGVLAKAVPKLPALANALRTGGFRTGTNLANASRGAKALDIGTRMAGAALPAAASQTMIDGGFENTGKAAGIAAALPPSLKFVGEAGKALKKGTGAVVKHSLGASTGTGAESVSAAYNAGKNKSVAFLDNMRGNVPFDDVVSQAKGALQTMRADRSQAYRGGMVDIAGDKAVVDFKPIADAVSKVSSMGSYKGQQINKNASGIVQDLKDTVDNWAALNPAEYHTPEGLDALKQAIGDIRDSTQFGTAARRSADTVYHAVKDQITAQAPTYAKVMKDYSEASTALQEAEKALSLSNKASADTSIRKLQSLMRNNAQTSYGNRLNIAKNLEDKGGVELLPAIAGQSMNAVLPRGITGAIQKGGAVLGAVGSGGASIPLTIAAAPFTSPRLVGESLYGLGRLTGAAGSVAKKGGMTPAQLAKKYPGLLDAQSTLYRAAPLMATSSNR